MGKAKSISKTYDVIKLKTVEECRTVIRRAIQRNLLDVRTAVFKRICELQGAANDDPADPMVRDFHETLAAYEQLLSEKNGKLTRASRTRLKIANKGIHQSLLDWTKGKEQTNGFKLLVYVGMLEYTGEYLVLRYASRFPEDVVASARDRLVSNGIAVPDEA